MNTILKYQLLFPALHSNMRRICIQLLSLKKWLFCDKTWFIFQQFWSSMAHAGIVITVSQLYILKLKSCKSRPNKFCWSKSVCQSISLFMCTPSSRWDTSTSAHQGCAKGTDHLKQFYSSSWCSQSMYFNSCSYVIWSNIWCKDTHCMTWIISEKNEWLMINVTIFLQAGRQVKRQSV